MSIKQKLSGYLRKIGIIYFFDLFRYYFQKTNNFFQNKRFKRSHPDFVFPPDYFLYESYRLRYKDYLMDGQVTAKEILGVIANHKSLDRIKLLDWGCGPGRVARHIPGLLGPGSEVHATDSNKKYIRWCRNHISDIRFSRNDIEPPMNFSSSYFDVVLGLSIFTHLSEHKHSTWLDELHRVLKPRGIVLLTTQGDFFRRKLLPEEHAQFESGQFVARRYIVEGHRLFSSFQPRKFMLSLVEKKFTVIDCIEGSNEKDALMEQDVWVLEKK